MSQPKTIGGFVVTDIQYELWHQHIAGYENLKIKKSSSGAIFTVDASGNHHGIYISASGKVQKHMNGMHHCTTGPAIIDGTKKEYRIYGYLVDERLYHNLIQVLDISDYSNRLSRTARKKTAYLTTGAIEELAKEWIWEHPNRNKILKYLISKAIEDDCDVQAIVNVFKNRSKESILVYVNSRIDKPLPEFSRTIHGLQANEAQQKTINKYVPEWIYNSAKGPSGEIILKCGKLQYTIAPDGSLKQTESGLLHSHSPSSPSVVTSDGTESYHLHGAELTPEGIELRRKYGLRAYKMLGVPPDKWNHVNLYQLSREDLPIVEKRGPTYFELADCISHWSFRTTKYTIDILQTLSDQQILSFGDIPHENYYSHLMSLLEPTEHNTSMLQAAAQVICQSVISAASSKLEVNNVHV